jgi:NADPH-dependent curcumin reductase CurA
LKPVISHEIHLVSHAVAGPALSDFELVSNELPALQSGQMLVRNLYMSVDSYMRGRLGQAKAPLPAFRLGEPLEGAAVGEVVASTAVGFAPGDAVTSMCGWRDYFVADPSRVRSVDRRVRPLAAYLGVLASTGLTAWAGFNLAEVRADESVFVSAAAGPVGSVTGQLAKLRGCHVSGAASSGAAARMLVRELGFDTALNDAQPDFRDELEASFPDGIDVYFDNVGGAQLGVILDVMRPQGRLVTCRALSVFDEPMPLKSAHNRELFVSKRLTLTGFTVSDWLSLAPVFQKTMSEHLIAGRIRAREVVVSGLERAPQALLDLPQGEGMGKIIVELA